MNSSGSSATRSGCTSGSTRNLIAYTLSAAQPSHRSRQVAKYSASVMPLTLAAPFLRWFLTNQTKFSSSSGSNRESVDSMSKLITSARRATVIVSRAPFGISLDSRVQSIDVLQLSSGQFLKVRTKLCPLGYRQMRPSCTQLLLT